MSRKGKKLKFVILNLYINKYIRLKKNVQNSTKSISPTVRTIITVVLLLLGLMWPIVGLIGIVVMWIWIKWPKWLKILITIPFGLFFALLFLTTVGVLAYLFFIRPFQVKGSAMTPNYNNGMYLMTNIVRPNNIVVNRDDVIIFKSPKNPDVEYIKRVIGLPGETVMLKSGEVYINGQKLDESKYLSPGVQTYGGAFITEGQTINIPSGQYFTLGDNRTHSSDSRDWGLVPQENITSKVAFCYWNCGKK